MTLGRVDAPWRLLLLRAGADDNGVPVVVPRRAIRRPHTAGSPRRSAGTLASQKAASSSSASLLPAPAVRGVEAGTPPSSCEDPAASGPHAAQASVKEAEAPRSARADGARVGEGAGRA